MFKTERSRLVDHLKTGQVCRMVRCEDARFQLEWTVQELDKSSFCMVNAVEVEYQNMKIIKCSDFFVVMRHRGPIRQRSDARRKLGNSLGCDKTMNCQASEDIVVEI
jgi:hypothetical protein